jgi:hypothetical protein
LEGGGHAIRLVSIVARLYRKAHGHRKMRRGYPGTVHRHSYSNRWQNIRESNAKQVIKSRQKGPFVIKLQAKREKRGYESITSKAKSDDRKRR